MELLELLISIVSGKKVDEHLPGGTCVPFDTVKNTDKSYNVGGVVDAPVSQEALYKLLCLQTLSMELRKAGGCPDIAEVNSIRASMSKSELEEIPKISEEYTMIHIMGIGLQQRCDLWERITMLEHLMVEIVRKNVPTEWKRLKPRYRINSQGQLLWVVIFEPRF